jgi:hypothetical protein
MRTKRKSAALKRREYKAKREGNQIAPVRNRQTEWIAQHRASMSEQDRRIAQETDRIAKKTRRTLEGNEQHETRLQSVRTQVRNNRLHESSEKRESRLQSVRIQMRSNRQCENSEKRKT